MKESTNPEQGLLFEAEQPPVAPVVDMGEWAARVGASARPVEHDRRFSDAAVDQGWGPQQIDMTDIVSDAPPVVDLDARHAATRRHPASGNAVVSSEGPRAISPHVRNILDGVRAKLNK